MNAFSIPRPGEITINDFKSLVINDLLSFVLTQDKNEIKTEEQWAENYAAWLETKVN